MHPSPKRHLIDYTRRYPQAGKIADQMRERAGVDLPTWPQWCFLPIGAAQAIASPHPEAAPTLEAVRHGAAGAALLAWRVTQGIYRFDSELLAELWATPVSGEVPAGVLERMGEWCVYIEAGGREVFSRPLEGFFAHLEYDTDSGRRELRLLLDCGGGGDDSPPSLHPIPLHLGAGATLEDALRGALSQSTAGSKSIYERLWALIEAGLIDPADLPADLREISGVEVEVEESDVEAYVSELTGPVSVLLYLASSSAELADASGNKDRPVNPSPKKTKKGMRLFPPESETYWQAGYRMGAALRAAKEQASGRRPTTTPEGRHRPVAHVRRAHWHSFWRGPRKDPARRELSVKWMPPLLVGASDPEELVPTIHKVGGGGGRG